VEAKSAQTLGSSFFQHLQTLAEDLVAGVVAGQHLVFGGEDPARRSGTEVIHWRRIQDTGWD